MVWKYLLFDLDGTLTDSHEGIVNCIKYALESLHKPIPAEGELLKMVGPPLREGFCEVAGLSSPEAEKAIHIYRERFGTVGLFENRLYDGIEQVLAMLQERGFLLVLATSKPEEYSVRILEHFRIRKYFTEIVGSTMDGSRNKKSEIIQETLVRLGISEEQKKEVIMIGDRKYDMIGAKECDIASLGVLYGFAPEHELEEYRADYIVEDVQGLLSFFI